MKLTVDRYENEYVICTDETGRFFALLKAEVPVPVIKGNIIIISDEGELTVQGS